MHHKRTKPKEHTFVDGYDSWKGTGNHQWRASKRDLRQPQMYTREVKNPWRYKNIEWVPSSIDRAVASRANG